MYKNKICNLDLIENIKKKKNTEINTEINNDLKYKFNLIIDKLIDYNFILNSATDILLLKNLILKFSENYININRIIKHLNYKTKDKKIIDEIMDGLISNVILRCDNNKKLVKEIVILKNYKKEIKQEIGTILMID